MKLTSNIETLVFCTSYIANQDDWSARYERWLDHHSRLPFGRALFCMIDDASLYLPDLNKVHTIEVGQPYPEMPTRALMVRFQNRLGRPAVDNYPGWWRSFLFSCQIAKHYRCKKIVHIESDAYVLTQHMLDFIVERDSGWTSFWCPRWNFPETAIQVICEDQFAEMQKFWEAGWERYAGECAELILPFTQVAKEPHGNRYGEFRSKIPSFADFAVQVTPQHDVWFK